MSMSALSKQKATTLTRAAQGALALLVVAAGAAVAMSSRFASDPERAGPLVLPTVDLGNGKNTPAPINNNIDFAAVGDRLGAVSNHPKPVVVATNNAPGAAQPPPPAPVNEMKYLGAVGVGANKVALISDNGRQRFVSVNDDLAGGKVEQITDTEVRVGGAASKVITLASRSSDVVTRAGAPRPATPGVNTARAPMPGTLQAYQPTPQPVDEALRVKGNIPDYVPQGEEREFMMVREELRATTKFASEDELNEIASKTWEEKKGTTPEMERYRKMQEGKEK
ncbi:MAG TPA: hypothetical protein VD997_16710 [Phycisphaerales bacterium]|nr:hypothetical protein [Phycisphaerales bacterium]